MMLYSWPLMMNLVMLFCLSCQSESQELAESKQPESVNQDTISKPQNDFSRISKNELLGKLDYSADTNFTKIAPIYSTKSNIYLRKEAYASFIKMHNAAKADGINLIIVSAARNFNYQKGIWERKWNGVQSVNGMNLAKTVPDPVERAKTILQYSSMPGTSRHHWGTDIDINNLNNAYFESGKGLKEYQWLKANAGKFGFCQTYTAQDESRPTGYFEEKWHWSYLPIAKVYTAYAKAFLKDQDITGFDGAEAAIPIQVVKNYVLGINQECF